MTSVMRRAAVIASTSAGLLVSLGLLGGGPPSPVMGNELVATGTLQAPAQLPECPFHMGPDTNPVFPPDVGPIAGIPEFHDCQGFSNGAAFVGPFAVYSLFKQEAVWDLVAKRDSTGGGTRDTAVLAAVIRSFGAAYPPLGIQPDYNCLYLFYDADNLVKARVVPNGTNWDCPDVVPPFAAALPLLEVKRHPVAGLTGTDYPPVARWEREPTQQRRYYIGVMCDQWCEVGPPGFASASTHNASGANTRGFLLNGWYDEQELALPAGGAGSGVVPSAIKGTIFPDFQLDQYVEGDFAATWKPVARIAFPATNPAYAAKLRLSNIALTNAPANTTDLNRVLLCKGTRAQCHVPATTRCSWAGAWPQSRTPGDTLWWAQVVPSGYASALHSAGGVPRRVPAPLQPKFICVVRRVHPTGGKHIPGTARWRWSATDETIWVRCDQGCCEVDQ